MSNIIQKITGKIEEVTALIGFRRESVCEESRDFSFGLELQSLEYHLEELQAQLRHEKLLRDIEVIELRLRGSLADRGAIPLDILSNIAKHFSGSLHSLAYRLKKGFDAKSKIPSDVIRTLNLKLAGMGYGSTRLYLSATSNPNLFGYSLIEDSLEKTFKVFSSHSPQELTDSVSEIGARSASNVNKLLKTLSRYNLEAELSWTDSQEINYKWEGTTESILTIANTLDSVINTYKESITICGEVMMLHKKGRFELREPDHNTTYKGQFPADVVEEITRIRVGEFAIGEIEIETTTNQTTGYEKTTYTLMSLRKNDVKTPTIGST